MEFKEHKFRCGYAPRSMQYSLASDVLFVGCKDGSITVVTNLADREPPEYQPLIQCEQITAHLQGGVRKPTPRVMCEWQRGRLLVGRDDGSIELLDWRSAKDADSGSSAFHVIRQASPEGDDRVTCMDWLDEHRLLVSYRRGGTSVVTRPGAQADGKDEIGPLVKSAFDNEVELIDSGKNRKSRQSLQGLIGFARLSERSWLLISQDGRIWKAGHKVGGHLQAERVYDFWPTGEVPGFVADFALVKEPLRNGEGGDAFDYRTMESRGVYISTDNGVYFLNEASGHGAKICPSRVSLPGLGRMCIAITYFASAGTGFLWVSDSGGDAHLFRDDLNKKHRTSPNWRRLGIRHEGSQVVLGFSSWRTLEGAFVVGQARRNDWVVISQYALESGSPEWEPAQVERGPSKLRLLLQRGGIEEIGKEVAASGEDIEDWTPEAILADFFELLGDHEESVRSLSEFLGHPAADVALKILDCLADAEPERPGDAVRVWNQALLGTVHRFGMAEKEPLYLGIIRWLRAISEGYKGKHKSEVQKAVEEQIVFTRKWGLFGNTYGKRRTATASVEALEGQKPFERKLDYYAYMSLLFQRQIDLEHEEDRFHLPGRTAWDLKARKVGDRVLVAASWIRSGIKLYEVVRDERSPGGGYCLDLCVELKPRGGNHAEPFRLEAVNVEEMAATTADSMSSDEEADFGRVPRDYGHSRAVIIGQLPGGGGELYLLACPAQRPETGGEHRFELWRLNLSGKRAEVVEQGRAQPQYTTSLICPGAPQESVYSLLELEPGLVLAGLRGHGGCAQVAVLKIELNSAGIHMRCLAPLAGERLASTPQGKSISRNPIWALARAEDQVGEAHIVFAGCNTGEVWKLSIPRFHEAENDFSMQPQQVGRLGAPVWALACRTSRSGEPVRRIFVGGADGSILAWQEVRDDREGERYITVWATWEEDGAIARIHPLEVDSTGEDSVEAVMVVTQQGRCLLFSDRSEIQATEGKLRHRRLRVQGERLGRLSLRATAFASDILPLPDSLCPRKNRKMIGRLLCATNDGRIHVYTLRFPFHHSSRKREYESLIRIWLDLICKNEEGSSGRPARYLPHALRRAEAAYIASPVAPLILVRELIELKGSAHWKGAPPLVDFDRQWLPHSLRPLFDLRQAWKDLDAQKAQKALEATLSRVFYRRDRGLFVEIMSVVLQQSNLWLFTEVPRLKEGGKALKFYNSLIEGLVQSINHWLGFPERAEIRIRAKFAENLCDGDALWCLRRGATELGEILKARIRAIRQLLVMGDPLLALETLNASNLALLRACRRLVEDGRRQKWIPDDPDQELPWESLEDYVKSLSDFAAAAFHRNQRAGDALAHEITRGFALAVCACPSAAIRVAHLMAEADLIVPASPKEDRSAAVLRQFALLKEVGVEVPEAAIRVFRWACSSRGDDGNVRRVLEISEREEGERLESIVGSINRHAIEASDPFYRILTWLTELARRLSTDATEIDLGKSVHLREDLEAETEYFSHSRSFWILALDQFSKQVLVSDNQKADHYITSDRPDRVQPEAVLRSRRVAHWCGTALEKLRELAERHEIFQPHLAIYGEALEQLRRAATEFPSSSAIQKNMVLGVLSHGLLESLDEHVLELEEIAQALDPLYVWEYRQRGRVPSTESSSKRAVDFSKYLLARSHEAESIPKNLRTLQGLLVPRSDDLETVFSERDLLLDFIPPEPHFTPKPETPGWILETAGSLSLSSEELRFLRLTLKELDQNDRNYGYSLNDRVDPSRWPKVWIRPGETGCSAMTLRFPLREDKENRLRLQKLQAQGLQNLYPRREIRDVASHGTGLYLANLAAAVVNWRLGIARIPEDEPWFEYLLERVGLSWEVEA